MIHIFKNLSLYIVAPVHMNLKTRIIQRFEERKPYDMVPVNMGEQHMNSINSISHQGIAKRPYPGTAVYDDNISGLIPDFDTG